jgi:ribonuclease Z
MWRSPPVVRMTRTAETTLKIHLLGCGTPTPSPGRFGSSNLIETAAGGVLVDCGPGTMTKISQSGVSLAKINALAITHLHFDHVSGVPSFVLTRWDQLADSAAPLSVIGPPGTANFIERLFGATGAFAVDTHARTGHPASVAVHQRRGGSALRHAPVVEVTELEAGSGPETLADLTVTAGRAAHVQPYLSCNTYRFEHPSGTMGITGDTRYSAEVAQDLRGVDTLVCCCRSHQDRMSLLGLDSTLCGTVDAGRLAETAGARRLVLTHMGAELDIPEQRVKARQDISRVFAGDLVFAEEGMAMDLASDPPEA